MRKCSCLFAVFAHRFKSANIILNMYNAPGIESDPLDHEVLLLHLILASRMMLSHPLWSVHYISPNTGHYKLTFALLSKSTKEDLY